MVPAAVVDKTIADLLPLLEAGDILIDGGNSYYVDDIRRAKELAPKGIHYVDVGTSGGVWGLERGYCMMIGGEPDVVKHLDPIFATLAPGIGDIPRTPGREKLGGTAEQGYLHCGPNGAGHFVKMVHNGIEYGIMAAYAEGLGILQRRQHRQAKPRSRCRDDAASRPRALPIRSQSARHRRSVAARQRDRFVAARSDRDCPDRRIPTLTKFAGRVSDSGEGRWTIKAAIDEACRCRCLTTALYERFSSRGEADFQDKLLSAMRFQFGGHLEKAANRSKDHAMSAPHSDALVFFGATGDLAYKKIFPSLQAMVKRGHLNVPVIGVAKAGWNLDQLKARAQDSLEKHGGLDPPRSKSCPGCCATSTATTTTPPRSRLSARNSAPRNGRRTISPFRPVAVRDGRRATGKSDCAEGARVIVEKPFGTRPRLGAASSTAFCSATFDEKRIFRIDHYLGKQPVHNMLFFRFANAISRADLESRPRRERADHDGRGFRRAGPRRFLRPDRRDPRRDPESFVPGAGQLAMEPPVRTDSESIRDEKVKVLKAIPPLKPEGRRPRPVPRLPQTKRRGAGFEGGDLRRAASWKSIPGAGSGVPFYIRAGKCSAGHLHGDRRPAAPAADDVSRLRSEVELFPVSHQSRHRVRPRHERRFRRRTNR